MTTKAPLANRLRLPEVAPPQSLAGPGTDFGSNEFRQSMLTGTGLTEPGDLQASPPGPGLRFVDAKAPQANGCGPASSPWWAKAGNASFPHFKEACNIHDTGTLENPGYSTLGTTKESADLEFLENMEDACDELYPVGTSLAADTITDILADPWTPGSGLPSAALRRFNNAACKDEALMLYELVKFGGQSAFESGQSDAASYGEANRIGHEFYFEEDI